MNDGLFFHEIEGIQNLDCKNSYKLLGQSIMIIGQYQLI